MACNCNKKKTPPTGAITASATQSFVLTTRDGKTETFASRLEANAARVRRGGGTIRPVR